MSASPVIALLTQAQRKVGANLVPTLADRLKLDEKNSRTISLTAKELETIQQKAEAAHSRAETVPFKEVPFKEVRSYGAIPLGGAVLTSAGRLPFKGIIKNRRRH